MELVVLRAKVKFELPIFSLLLEALNRCYDTCDLIRLKRYMHKIASLQ